MIASDFDSTEIDKEGYRALHQMSRSRYRVNLQSLQDVDAWCRAHGLRVTERQRAVTKIVRDSRDYPDVNELHRRVAAVSPRISLATVYRTLRLLLGLGLIERHTFQGKLACYAPALDKRQGHLIDIASGRVIEFQSDEIERLEGEIAGVLGYRLTGHKLELYGEPVCASARHRSHMGAPRSSRSK